VEQVFVQNNRPSPLCAINRVGGRLVVSQLRVGERGLTGPSIRQRLQSAAAPYCRTDLDEPRLLLVTSRRTRRWVLPKGWPKPGEALARAAEREAFEEAGVLGHALDARLGEYVYDKRLGGGVVECRVAVFALRVTAFAAAWPERGQRALRWCSPHQAARLVREPGLRALLARFDPPPSALDPEPRRFRPGAD